MAKRKPGKKTKKKGKPFECRPGWFPVEVDIGRKKTILACGRIPVKPEKGKKSGWDWASGTIATLDVITGVLHGLAQH